MKTQNERKFRPNWRRIIVAAAVVFFCCVGIYNVAVAAYNAAVDGADFVQGVVEETFPEQKPIVVEYDYHEQVVAHYDGNLLSLIQQQGFSYREALALADEVRAENGLSGTEVTRGTVLWLPTRADR